MEAFLFSVSGGAGGGLIKLAWKTTHTGGAVTPPSLSGVIVTLLVLPEAQFVFSAV